MGVAVVARKNNDSIKKSMKYRDRIIQAFDGDHKQYVSAVKLKSRLGLTSKTQMNAFKAAIEELNSLKLLDTRRASYRLRAAAKKLKEKKEKKKEKKTKPIKPTKAKNT